MNDLGICRVCEKKPAVLSYSDSVLETMHGMATPMCLKCYEKRLKFVRKTVDKTLKRIADGNFLKELK